MWLINQNFKKDWDNHMKIKQLEQQIIKDNDKLVAEILQNTDKDDFECKEKVGIRTIKEELEINKLLKRNQYKQHKRMKDHAVDQSLGS